MDCVARREKKRGELLIAKQCEICRFELDGCCMHGTKRSLFGEGWPIPGLKQRPAWCPMLNRELAKTAIAESAGLYAGFEDGDEEAALVAAGY